MLLPRFSLRTMLVVAAAVAVASVFAGQAVNGRVWAMGVTIGILSIGAGLLMQAAFFGVGSLAARWLGPQEIVARTSRGGVERTTVTEVLDTSTAPRTPAPPPTSPS